MFQVLSQVLEAAPEPPSRQRSDVPARLEEIALRALQKSRGDRFADMRTFGAALESWREAPARGSSRGKAVARVALGLLALSGPVGLAGVAYLALWGPQGPRVSGEAQTPPPRPSQPGPSPTPSAAGPQARPSSWSARYLVERLPRVRRLSRDVMDEAVRAKRAEASRLAERWTQPDCSRGEVFPRASALAEEGSELAQMLLADIRFGDGDREGGLELVWTAARHPGPHPWASLGLGHRLFEFGDSAGARWANAEAAVRADDLRIWDLTAQVCRAAVWLGTPADLGRALRLARPVRSELQELRSNTAQDPDFRWVLAALEADTDSSALLTIATTPPLIRATRCYLARHPTPALRALADGPRLASADLPPAWLSGPPLEHTWSQADIFALDDLR